jgi:ParB-like chromosome segregation protein Spo0J
MIHASFRFRIARIPLAQIVITEVEPRYAARMQHYAQLLRDTPDKDVMLALSIQAQTSDGTVYYNVLDGHHRFLGSLLAGRKEVLGLIHYVPGDPGYDTAAEVCGA